LTFVLRSYCRVWPSLDGFFLQPLSCFLHISSLEFSKRDCFIFSLVCNVTFDWKLKTHKSDSVRGSSDLFTPCCHSRGWMPSCCNHFRDFFISLGLSSQSGICLYFRGACAVSFDLHLKARISDTVRGSSDLFTVGCRSHRWMASCYNYFQVFFLSLALSSQT
jgi:hypothetical protein